MSIATILALCGLALLSAFYFRQRAATRQQRGAFFGRCLPLFKRYRVVQDDVGYPVLRGAYQDREVVLEPVIDAMSWRKLPILYLKASVVAPTAYNGVIDYLMRASGFETFTQAPYLDHRLAIPADWPQDAILATDDPDRAPPLDLIAPHIGKLPVSRLKELVVTPRGVRIVYKIEECSRPHYAAFREITFEQLDLDPEDARIVLDAAVALHEAVAVAREHARVA